MVRGIWDEERRIIIANLKKLKKAYIDKAGDKVDQILYPQKEMEKKLAKEAKSLIAIVVAEVGQREIDRLGLEVAFDVTNPEVTKWLKEYVPKFSKKLEEVSIEKLRAELIAGIEKGETLPELMRRVNTTYDHWDKIRAERISRSESIRAANAGAKSAYIQSGVVEKIVWIATVDKRICPYCEEMDGRVIGIKENFFDKGDVLTVTVDGKKQSMKLDYSDTPHPPLHTLCRCSIGAEFSE